MSTSHLILVRHAMPDIVPDAPSREWRLGDAGRAGSMALAPLLADYEPAVIVTSDEPKAIQTGEVVAVELGLAARVMPGLHEHERPVAALMEQTEFETTIEALFRQPDTLVYGSETANEALLRFAGAIEHVRVAFPDGTIVVVAHGTVMSLFVSQVAGVEAFSLWRRLGLPSFVVFDRNLTTLVRVVEDVVTA